MKQRMANTSAVAAELLRSHIPSWLIAMYRELQRPACNGCTLCADKCAGNIMMIREEAKAILQFVREAGIAIDKLQAVDEWQPCPFLDASRLCAIYPVRPLICRLFGLVPFLPCPAARVEPVADEVWRKMLEEYCAHKRLTLWQWMTQLA